MSLCPVAGQVVPRQKRTVQEVFVRHGRAFMEDVRLTPQEKRVMEDIMHCRTAALGGHRYRCDKCGREVCVYNSCLNRHCPNCDNVKQEEWLDERRAELLPVTYFHNVFTLPHEFNRLALANKDVVYKILFDAVAGTLKQFGEERLKGTLGFILVLHTWDQLMGTHIHLHSLIPGGALSFDCQRWNRPVNEDVLFSIEELGREFRRRFLELLRAAYGNGKLCFPPPLRAAGKSAEAFEAFLEVPAQKDWVVYSKPSYSHPENAIAYLSRYTHRIAISNSRIVDVTDDSVTFSYKDRRHDIPYAEKTVTPVKFLRSFLNHVLPSGFHRIRYYGLLHQVNKKRLLPLALLALGESPLVETPEPKSARDRILENTGRDIHLCPHCHRGRLAPAGIVWPTSDVPRWRLRLLLASLDKPP